MHMFSEYVNKHTCRETCKHLFYTCASRDTHMHRYMYIYIYICISAWVDTHYMHVYAVVHVTHLLRYMLCTYVLIHAYIFMNTYIYN